MQITNWGSSGSANPSSPRLVRSSDACLDTPDLFVQLFLHHMQLNSRIRGRHIGLLPGSSPRATSG
ncbi:hypothetical protein LX36DRAFT_660000 [Colletotrichum falcatum]|nr:hypothetical protein LX36DRAFT_660000 [Colletotrichum falcatum]